MEKIIANKNGSDSKLVTESLVAQNYLEESASQLTYHGLCELGTKMKENELAIFFRNNHFSTIHKRNNVSVHIFCFYYVCDGPSKICSFIIIFFATVFISS